MAYTGRKEGRRKKMSGKGGGGAAGASGADCCGGGVMEGGWGKGVLNPDRGRGDVH